VFVPDAFCVCTWSELGAFPPTIKLAVPEAYCTKLSLVSWNILAYVPELRFACRLPAPSDPVGM